MLENHEIVAKEYLSGDLPRDICKIHGCTYMELYRVLKSKNIKMRPKPAKRYKRDRTYWCPDCDEYKIKNEGFGKLREWKCKSCGSVFEKNILEKIRKGEV